VNQRLPLSDLRLARLVLWAGLMLQAAAGWLFANAHAAPDWLNDQLRAPALYLRCVVLSLIIVIAARRAPPPKRCRSRRPLAAPPGFSRARGRCARWRGLIGSRLWRRTRGTPAQIIAALHPAAPDPADRATRAEPCAVSDGRNTGARRHVLSRAEQPSVEDVEEVEAAPLPAARVMPVFAAFAIVAALPVLSALAVILERARAAIAVGVTVEIVAFAREGGAFGVVRRPLSARALQQLLQLAPVEPHAPARGADVEFHAIAAHGAHRRLFVAGGAD
jgi:hypothetical protein